jgi:hypothetical protein
LGVYQNPNDLRHDDANVRDAVRFGVGVAVAGVAFLVVAAVWVSTCDGATADTVACGAPQRTPLAIGAPVILLIGGLRAFVRTYQTWRKQETWWAWQGAGWFLLTLMLIVLTMSMPPWPGSRDEPAGRAISALPVMFVSPTVSPTPELGSSTVEISPCKAGRGMPREEYP